MLIIALIGSFVVVTYGVKIKYKFLERYPTVDCDPFHENYGKYLGFYAYGDWKLNENQKHNHQETNYVGYL